MRLWSIHPRYLDSKGLVACWREALLAQKVLAGGTVGYRNHPQLTRFRTGGDPIPLIGSYLGGLAVEADSRGYRFNRALILEPHAPAMPRLSVTTGQLAHERKHLLTKLAIRAVELVELVPMSPEAHPLFATFPGPIEVWEVP